MRKERWGARALAYQSSKRALALSLSLSPRSPIISIGRRQRREREKEISARAPFGGEARLGPPLGSALSTHTHTHISRLGFPLLCYGSGARQVSTYSSFSRGEKREREREIALLSLAVAFYIHMCVGMLSLSRGDLTSDKRAGID